MDQMTATCGESHSLLALKCQPAELEKMVSLPDDIELWGLDSGICHSVSGADYSSARVGAFMGYRIIAELAGLAIKPAAHKHTVQIDDSKWGGYLANLSPSEFEQFYSARLPDRMSGNEFLSRYKGTTDSVSRVNPERSYIVRNPTAHPIYENFRVRTFAELLNRKPTEQRLELLGELMYQSHASYSACGLGSSGTDLLVKLVREAGPSRGFYGARITGGGSGGTVAVLCRRGAAEAVRAIAEQYRQETGYGPYVFHGSSPGASKVGHLRLRKER
jgi:L-arabinokinase